MILRRYVNEFYVLNDKHFKTGTGINVYTKGGAGDDGGRGLTAAMPLWRIPTAAVS